jgi:hypothetical protein
MQQHPRIIFWLLFAATAAVDAVVLRWAAGLQPAAADYQPVAVAALVLGEASIIYIWSALRPFSTLWSKVAPVCAVVLAASVNGVYFRMTDNDRGITTFTTFLGFFGLHAVLLMAALWFLQRTNFWRRLSGAARSWQFSLLHILATMTITAVLATLIRGNVYFSQTPWTNLAFTCSYVALAVCSVIVWSCRWNWFLRLAGVLGISLLIGFGANVMFFRGTSGLGLDVFNVLHAFYVIQAVVLSLWLGLGQILPSRFDARETERPEPQVQS